MNVHVATATELTSLLEDIQSLRVEVIEGAAPIITKFIAAAGRNDVNLENLAHYLSLRQCDIRELQRRLMVQGLSSLNRLESQVLPTLDGVIATLAVLTGTLSSIQAPTRDAYFFGKDRLAEASDRLFGPPRPDRRCRIMVTLSPGAVPKADLILNLVIAGMDIARIDCEHDDRFVWKGLVEQVRDAGKAIGRDIKILMDISRPNIRIDEVRHQKKAKLIVGDVFHLVDGDLRKLGKHTGVCVRASLPDMLTRLKLGDRFQYDDGKMEGRVESLQEGQATIRVTKTASDGIKLKLERSISLPDTTFGLSPFSMADGALDSVIACADMLGYSFVSSIEEIDLLETEIANHGLGDKPLGLVAKMGDPDTIKNLPYLIARAVRNHPVGIMIASDDMAVETGFEHLVEMREDIICICEAAAIPAIWATQVLENLVKTGTPSRGEMADAAMASQAECIMVNRGPRVREAVEALDRLLVRRDANILTPTPRALESCCPTSSITA